MLHILHLKYEDTYSGTINVLGHILKVRSWGQQHQHYLGLVRNANSPPHPRFTESGTLGVELA